MEHSPIRDLVHDFTRACLAPEGFAHAHNGLTDLEHETVRKFVHALEQELGPLTSQPSPDDPPLATTLSNFPPID